MTTPSSKNSRLYARFIPREEVGDVTQWKFGAVDGSDAIVEEPEEAPAAEVELDEAARQEALEAACAQAFANGEAHGRAQASLEWQQRMDDYVANGGREVAQRLGAVVQALDGHLADLRQGMAESALELACEIARQVVRQELRTNPQALLPVVREALGMLATDGRAAVVRLNPQDQVQLDAALRREPATVSLQWVADASVPPGGCLVEQAGMVVDGSLEKRWLRAIAPLGLALEWEQQTHDDATE